jgi:hypothetical protein
MRQHYFDIEVAAEYGVHSAIFINHFQFWIAKNRSAESNFHDGRTYTYGSNKSLAALFPYFTEKQVRDTLKKLENGGVLVSGNYNKTAYDRTKWYAFVDEEKWLGSYGIPHPTKKSDLSDQKAQPIPDNITDNKKDSPAVAGQADSDCSAEQEIERMWQSCPEYLMKRGIAESKANALIGRWFKKHGAADVIRAVGVAVRAHPRSPIPYITRVLNPEERDTWSTNLDMSPIR